LCYNKDNEREVIKMNEEIIKAMNRKPKKNTFGKWWSKNGYKVMRVILFPIWWGIKAKEKIENYLNSKCGWSEERANEVLAYYIPRKAEWNAEDKSFYFFDNGMGWGNLAKKHLKHKDRRWWNIHRGWTGGKIRSYLIDKFELEGFTKEVGECSDGWTEVTFKLIEK